MKEETPLIPPLVLFGVASVATYTAYAHNDFVMVPVMLFWAIVGFCGVVGWFNESISHY